MKPYTKILIGIVILLLVIAAGILIIKKHTITESPSPEPTPSVTLTSPATRFAWSYADGGEDQYGLSQTKIVLDTSYENGKVISTTIDTVQGTCNDIDAKAEDADRVAGSTKIQCYAAGFGQWYKIIKGTDSYEIRRKYFEEAHPDSVPPEYSYETVATIPFTQ